MAMPTCSKRRRGGTINKYARLPPGYAMQLVQQTREVVSSNFLCVTINYDAARMKTAYK